MVWRHSKPDWRRRTLVTILADRGNIENAGGGKCVEVALGNLGASVLAVRARLRGGGRRNAGRHRQTAERDRAPCDYLPPCERVRDSSRRVAAVANGCSIHLSFLS